MKNALTLFLIAVILAIASCEKEGLARFNHKDYALLYVYDKEGDLIAIDGLLPLDTMTFGDLKIVYKKREIKND